MDAQPPTPARYPDLVVCGQAIRTLSDADAEGDADTVAVAEGRILAVGRRSEVEALVGPQTRVIDLAGATIMPGLVDAHTHVIYSLGIVRGTSLAGVTTYAGLVAALERGRIEQDSSEWFFGWGLDPNAFEGRAISNQVLHEVLGADRPAYIKMFDAHSALASDAALARAGIAAPITHADGSAVIDDGAGQPSGHLLEFTVMDVQEAVLPARTFAERATALRLLLHDMASLGITGTHVMDLNDPDALELLETLERDGDLPVRLRLSPWCVAGTDDDEIARIIALQGRHGRCWRVEGVKLFLDGTVEGGTAWLDLPDADGQSKVSTWADSAAYVSRVRLLHDHGVPTATHAIGDHAIRFAAQTLAALPSGGPQHRIEHLESVDLDVLEIIAAAGIATSMQPTHCTNYVRADGGDDWSRRLGPARAARAWRTADVRRAGGVLALGSDWPIAAYNPWVIIADAQLRRRASDPEQEPIAAEQALTARQALEGYTTHAYRSIGATGGTLAVGMPADFVALAVDPLRVSADEVARVRPLLTVMNGRITHHARG